MTRRVAFATHAGLPELYPDDRLAVQALVRRGLVVTPCVWSDPALDWGAFDLVILRSCWDYHRRTDEFLAWIARVERLGVRVANPPLVLRWNLDKAHLVELQAAGVAVVPTALVARGAAVSLASMMDENGWEEAVFKPTVSMSADDTHRVARAAVEEHEERFRALLSERALLVQRFLPEIATEGERSYVFIGGRFGHAVVKRPAPGDFRVQSEHGGSRRSLAPDERDLAQVRAFLAEAPGPLLYARVDAVIVGGRLVLMELELIDPTLYFAAAEGAADAFADAVLDLQA